MAISTIVAALLCLQAHARQKEIGRVLSALIKDDPDSDAFLSRLLVLTTISPSHTPVKFGSRAFPREAVPSSCCASPLSSSGLLSILRSLLVAGRWQQSIEL